MKKVLLSTVIIVFLMSGAAMAVDQEGKMMATGYLGYTFGFGGFFGDNGGIDVSAGFNFGGTFHYGINEKLMVGGELGLQSYKTEIAGFSDSETKLNIIASGLMDMNTTDEGGLFLTAGLGYYGGFDAIGINGGIIYSKTVSESIKLFGMPRLHIVFDDQTPMMLSLSVGAQFGFGDRY